MTPEVVQPGVHNVQHRRSVGEGDPQFRRQEPEYFADRLRTQPKRLALCHSGCQMHEEGRGLLRMIGVANCVRTRVVRPDTRPGFLDEQRHKCGYESVCLGMPACRARTPPCIRGALQVVQRPLHAAEDLLGVVGETQPDDLRIYYFGDAVRGRRTRT